MGKFTIRADICQAAAMKVGAQDITSVENPKTVTESRLSFLYDQTKDMCFARVFGISHKKL